MTLLRENLRPSSKTREFSQQYKNNFEDHLLVLRGFANLEDVPREHIQKSKYDFYMLLTYMGIGDDQHWETLRLNGYMNPSEYDGSRTTILTPGGKNYTDIINKIKQA